MFDLIAILRELVIDHSFYETNTLPKIKIEKITSINEATNKDLAFCSLDGEEAVATVSDSNARAILCNKILEGQLSPPKKDQYIIFVDNSRLTIIRIMNKLYGMESSIKHLGTAPTAQISKSARMGMNCSIGNFTKIGDKCIIGDNTIVGDRVIIEQNTRVGKNCIIQPGTVIGADGFAYERLEDSLELQRFPHIGGVVLGNDVEICSNCSIARGSLSDTIIGDGTKLDALIHVAHNVEIGKNCALTAGTVIGGSTKIGDTCWTGLNSTIKHKVKIGNKVIIGSGASVINDIPDEDIVAGVPAKSIKHKVKSKQLFLMAGHTDKNIPSNTKHNGDNSNNNRYSYDIDGLHEKHQFLYRQIVKVSDVR